ncbi:CPBP family intramembrane glutamic endopeptidase [Thermodesulfobacteriota bacterium]
MPDGNSADPARYIWDRPRQTTSPLIRDSKAYLFRSVLGWTAALLFGAVGAVFMLLYLRTGSLPAVMLSHFGVNFIDLANTIPKSIFKFI